MVTERISKLALLALFLVTVFLASQHPLNLNPFDYLVLGLAATRMGRIIAFEHIFEPFRAPLAVTKKHEYAGDYTDAKYDTGWKHSIGCLITCPTCASTWAILLTVVGLIVAHDVTWLLVSILAIVSVGEIGNSLIEFLCWGSEKSRRESK